MSLTETELEILDEIDGGRPSRPWGAHVGQALEVLVGCGYVQPGGRRLTDKGLTTLDEWKTKP